MSHAAVWQSRKAKSGNSHIERNFDQNWNIKLNENTSSAQKEHARF